MNIQYIQVLVEQHNADSEYTWLVGKEWNVPSKFYNGHFLNLHFSTAYKRNRKVALSKICDEIYCIAEDKIYYFIHVSLRAYTDFI